VTGICAVILAAGEGQRLRPLTAHRPKALCPVGNIPLLDRALARLAGLGLVGPRQVAVNAAYLADQIVAHVDGRAQLSVEPRPLGTTGGVARLREWIDGRGVLVGNADAYLAADLPPGPDIAALLAGWDGRRVRLLVRPLPEATVGGFSGHAFAGFSLLPWHRVRELTEMPQELVATVWRPAEAAGELDLVSYPGTYIDTGTPADYLAANLHTIGSANALVAADAQVSGQVVRSVVGAGALVAGRIERCVVWPGGVVSADEHLADAVRVGADLTVRAGSGG